MKLASRKYLIMFMFFPAVCFANGAAPLLLIVSGSSFIFGQIWIIASETYIYRRYTKMGVFDALIQVFFVNLVSTFFVGIGFPIALAAISLAIGMNIPPPYDSYFSLLGTWAYEHHPYGKYLATVTLIWLLVTFFLTVLCERWVLAKIWKRKKYTSPIAINKLMWLAHTVSYSGLTMLILVMWRDIFHI